MNEKGWTEVGVFSEIQDREGTYFISPSHDTAYNLSLEEYLLENLEENQWFFLLYVNQPSVVLGKNQVPWKEIKLDKLREKGLDFFRRISGGGCVYHDLGNVNFSFMLPLEEYKKEKVSEWVLNLLRPLGIHGEMNQRGDLLFQGKKFSGNAYRITRGKVLHHGTLLIESDLRSLQGVLGAMEGDFETKAVSSVPMAVTNLSAVSGTLGVQKIIEAFQQEFSLYWEPWNEDAFGEEGKSILNPYVEKHKSAQWKFGQIDPFERPDFIYIDKNFPIRSRMTSELLIE